jgi:hypothetical protein
MRLKKRLDRLENYCPQNRTVKDMTDKELEELICAELGIPANELTEERLEGLIQAIASGEKPAFTHGKHTESQI